VADQHEQIHAAAARLRPPHTTASVDDGEPPLPRCRNVHIGRKEVGVEVDRRVVDGREVRERTSAVGDECSAAFEDDLWVDVTDTTTRGRAVLAASSLSIPKS
jgi:hypothetical protein